MAKNTIDRTDADLDLTTERDARQAEAARRAAFAVILSDAALDPERYIANYDARRGAE